MSEKGSLDSGRIRHYRRLNTLQSVLLVLLMVGFMALLGWRLWGVTGLVVLLCTGLIAALFNPAQSPRWVMRLYGAVPVVPHQAPALCQLVQWLSQRAGLSHTPVIYHIPSRVLNAFSVGSRGQSAIAISDGMLRQLSLRELAGVLGHEISHIQHNDLWVMGLADLFSRLTSLLAFVGQCLLLVNLPLMLFGLVTFDWGFILLLIIAPTISALAQLALSRTREYGADLNAATLTGDPEGLASALNLIEMEQGSWLEHMLMPGRRVPVPSLLRTHPRTEERIERLLALRPEAGEALPLEELVHDLENLPSRRGRDPRRRITGIWY